MAICTYLHDYEFSDFQKVEDKELNELFQEVRELIPDTFFVQQHKVISKKWLKKPTTTVYYSLYKLLSKPEVQEINFFVDNSDSSINTVITKGMLMAYFFGVISGHRYDVTQAGGVILN